MRDWTKIPPALPGQRIGILGGTFNPAHDGHRHISLMALRRLRLQKVWWMVTPGNPLKDNDGLPPLDQRARYAEQIANHPAITVSGLEAGIRTRFTYDTLAVLTQRFPATRFVWLMGADNLVQFHHWQGWQEIAHLMPIAVIDRPGSSFATRSSVAAQALARFRVREADAGVLPLMKAPAWTFLHGPRSDLSSTAIRAGRQQVS
ncbi:MAG: nicotinate-nucleotide adenylyltransferase [Hyphomicrobiales bacterium]